MGAVPMSRSEVSSGAKVIKAGMREVGVRVHFYSMNPKISVKY